MVLRGSRIVRTALVPFSSDCRRARGASHLIVVRCESWGRETLPLLWALLSMYEARAVNAVRRSCKRQSAFFHTCFGMKVVPSRSTWVNAEYASLK